MKLIIDSKISHVSKSYCVVYIRNSVNFLIFTISQTLLSQELVVTTNNYTYYFLCNQKMVEFLLNKWIKNCGNVSEIIKIEFEFIFNEYDSSTSILKNFYYNLVHNFKKIKSI